MHFLYTNLSKLCFDSNSGGGSISSGVGGGGSGRRGVGGRKPRTTERRPAAVGRVCAYARSSTVRRQATQRRGHRGGHGRDHDAGEVRRRGGGGYGGSTTTTTQATPTPAATTTTAATPPNATAATVATTATL